MRRFRLLTLSVLALLCGLFTGSASATNYSQFTAGSWNYLYALYAGVTYWGANYQPCNGTVSIVWTPLSPSINANSTWNTAYAGAPWTNYNCVIEMNSALNWDYAMECTVLTHEIGHLYGYYSPAGYRGDHQHSPDYNSVMYPFYVGARALCHATDPLPDIPGAPPFVYSSSPQPTTSG